MKLNKFLKTALNITFVIFILLLSTSVVSALNVGELKNQIDDLQSQLDKLNADKKSLQDGAARAKNAQSNAYSAIESLNSQVEQSKNEVEIVNLEIQKSQTELELTKQNIIKAENDIKKLDEDIIKLQVEQKARLNNIYYNTRVKNNTETETLIPTQIDRYITKTAYQKQLKVKGDQVFVDLNDKKEKRENEYTEIEKQKLEQEKLDFALRDQKDYLEKLKVQLSSSIAEQKNYAVVLGQTIQNNTEKSKELESQAAELKQRVNQLQQELFAAVNSVPANGVWVNKGDFIGFQGDTGYSTGPHLHFFLSKNGSGLLDPCNYLPSGVNGNCNYGNGEIQWPMTEVNWSRGYNYPDWGHGAIDIYAWSETEIYAAHEGYLIRGKEKCYSWFPICKDGGANYVIICQNKNCTSGFKTGYWHLK